MLSFKPLYILRWVTLAALMHVCLSCISAGKESQPGSYYEAYFIKAATPSSADQKWAQYLYNHIANRASDTLIYNQPPNPDLAVLTVEVSLDPKAPHDYAVTPDEHTLRLTARNEEYLLWLIYQFISAAGAQDLRITGSDLPPAIVPFNGTEQEGDFAFEFRSIYSPSSLDPDMMAIMAIESPDYHWGLWGHNIHKILPKNLSPSSLALDATGKRNDQQICLSSEEVYRAYENYVLDGFGEKGSKFMVMPYDHPLACQCPKCLKAGNTSNSATGALTALVTRLAKRFPNHRFFMGAYSSTIQAPSTQLPQNVGVIISALDLLMKADPGATAQGKNLEKLISQWRQATPNIYVWDYMRNFDDYLTPYPLLHLLPERLKWMKKLGVTGVFFNGSGEDYASFDDVQTFVISSLLINPNLNIDRAVADYFQRFYPVNAPLLTEYYLGLESDAVGTLPTYGGISQAVKAGLNPDKLRSFARQLQAAPGKADKEPSHKLSQLLTALSFTQLELMRLPGEKFDTATASKLITTLSAHKDFPNMDSYRETGGDMDQYIDQLKSLDLTPLAQNRLSGRPVEALSQLDEDYNSTACLTDGKMGLPTDYHTGWLIFSGKELKLQIPPSDFKTITLGLLEAPEWHIALPQKIEIWQNGQLKHTATNLTPTNSAQRKSISINPTGLDPSQPVKIVLFKPSNSQSIAIDEITAR